MDAEPMAAEAGLSQKAGAYTEVAIQSAIQTSPAALQFVDLLRRNCSIRCLDIVDHLIASGSDFEDAGWVQFGEHRWRHPDPSMPDIVQGDRPGFAIRVDDIQHFANVARTSCGSDAIRWIGRRLRLVEGSDVVVEAVDEASWRGLCAPPSDRIARRARVHRQLLRTRPRQFKSLEGGIEVTTRMLQGAVADLGTAWASALFLCAEREFWASRCEAGYLSFRRQLQFGIGWSNVEYHSYDCSRAHFHLYVKLFEGLGFRARGVLEEASGDPIAQSAGRKALIMEHQALRAIVLLKVDGLAADAVDDFGQALLSPTTWHGQSGLWCALHGESILDGGMSHIAARYDAGILQSFFARENVELLAPFPTANHALQLTKGDRRAVDPRRVYGLERRGYIGRDAAEDFRMSGAIATHFAIVQRNGSGPCLACSPETPLARGEIEKNRARRRRWKRSSTRASLSQT